MKSLVSFDNNRLGGSLGSGSEPNLDILRSIAVLLVVLDHWIEFVGRRTNLSFHPFDFRMGRLGVLLFFVHTSLVLMRSMDRMHVNRWSLVSAFYVRRIFRIYPLAILCVLLAVEFRVPPMPWETFSWPGWTSLASNIALTTNLTTSAPVLDPLWTLPIEVQMYLLLPVLFLVLKRERSASFLALAWLGTMIAGLVIPQFVWRLSNLAEFSPCFFAGAVSAFLALDIRSRLWGGAWLPALVCLAAAYVSIGLPGNEVHNPFVQWFTCAFVALLIPLFKQSESTQLNRLAGLVARYSYGVYLFHIVALWIVLIALHEHAAWLQLAAAVMMTMLFSMLTYHVLEEPMIKVGARVAKRMTGTR